MPARPLDRLDRRLASRRLSGRHARALGRALARLRADPRPACGALSFGEVFVARDGQVRFERPPGRVGADEVAALVRELAAEGAARRAEQLAASYALHADDYAIYRRLGSGRAAPILVVTGGRVASGKSTVAKAVARRLAAPRVVADRVRRAVLAGLPDDRAHELAWAPELGERVYGGLFERGGLVLASGRPVVLDACFPTAARRRAAAELADRFDAGFVFAHCEAPAADVRERLRLRDARDGTAPGGWQEIARTVDAQWEPPADGEPGRRVRIDTRGRPGAWLRALGLAEAAGA